MSDTGEQWYKRTMGELNQSAREIDTLTLPAREAYAKAKAQADAALCAVMDDSTTLTVAVMDAMQAHHDAYRAALDQYLAALEALKQGG